MSDPIDRMNQFRSDVEGGPMLPAADVRARGDQLRRRRTTAITAGAALAVAAIVTPLALLATGGTTTNDDPDPAEPSQTTDSTVPTDALTEATLLTDDETEYDGSADWVTEATVQGQPVWAACEVGPPADELGATTDFQRRFTLDTDDPEVADRQPRMTQMVAEFPDTDTARHAFENVMTMYDSGACAPQGSINDGPVVPPMWTVDIGDGVEARVSLSTFLYAPGDEAALVTAGIAVVADRLTVVSMVVPHDPSLASEAGSPMPTMLRTAAAKLGADVDPPAQGGLSDANLLRDEDTVFTDEVRWTLADTYQGEGQAALHACEVGTPTAHGATAVFRREWQVDGVFHLGQGVAEFPSPTAAQQAYTAIRDEVMACEQHASDDWTASASDAPGPGVDGRTTVITGNFTLAGEEGGEAFNDHDLTVGLAVAGDRVTVLAHDRPSGSEFPLGDPVALMLPTAAERLASEQPEGPSPEEEWPFTTIPEDFPLAAGWPAEPDQATAGGLAGPEIIAEPLSFDACGEEYVDDAYRAGLTASFANNVEDDRRRQLTTYETVEDANTAISAILELHEACTGAQTYETQQVDAGEEAWAILLRADSSTQASPFGVTQILLRAGNAVLLLERGGGTGYPSGTGTQDLDTMLADAAYPIAAMCERYGDGKC